MARKGFKLLWIFVLVASCALAQSSPFIGITSVFLSSESDTIGRAATHLSYVNAVLEAGGTPVVLPTVRSESAILDYAASLDGLILVGGRDIPPHVYGESAHPTVDSLSTQRFWFESRLISVWLTRNKPLFGICLGCQFTNVMSGGTLIQDIPSEIGDAVVHRQEGGAQHRITIDTESRLYSILGQESIVVNSYHHQAVDTVGKHLTVAARAPDGVIEALEFTSDRFGLFVQWHPERMDTEHRTKLFGAFVQACQ